MSRVNELTKLSKHNLGHYVFSAGMDVGQRISSKPKNAKDMDTRVRKQLNRTRGVGRAMARLAKEETKKEPERKKPPLRISVTRPVGYTMHSIGPGGKKTLEKSGTLTHEETMINESGGMSDEAHELVLHADNDQHLYHSSHTPIMNNLKKKMKKGTYNSEKAKKLWGYHADRAAHSYHKEHGGGHGKWHEMFSTKHRKEAAAHWEAHHRDELSEEVALYEITKKLLSRYVDKAAISVATTAGRAGRASVRDSLKDYNKIGSRTYKIGQAARKMGGMTRVAATEETITEGKKKVQILPSEAHEILSSAGGHDKDFHALSSTHVQHLVDKAKEYGYRKPASASGSTGRYFHAHLTKIAARHVKEETLDEKKKPVVSASWIASGGHVNPPEVVAKFAKQRAEKKQFGSAKREINKLRNSGK